MSMGADVRIGLGCMRLSTESTRDDARARATIDAALAAGIRLFDTAHAYALDDSELGHNERLLGEAIRAAPADVRARVRVVSKVGMTRPSGAWRPDGRARTISAHCEASLEALGGVPIDVLLLHAPDPSVSFATSVRALASLVERKLVRTIGVSNVTRAQLDEALAIAPISAVELSLGWFDANAIGVAARALERGLTVLAHRPLGGAKKQRALARDAALRAVSERHACSPQAAALAAILDLHPRIVALPGATRPETARDCARALAVTVDDADRARFAARLPRALLEGPRPTRALRAVEDAEVVLVMGVQGAGKTDTVRAWEERGYVRLNRDALGGTMRSLHRRLGETLASAGRVVLDNTYLTRAVRQQAITTAWKHGVAVRGVWLEIAMADAQVNVVQRMLAAHGRLLAPADLTGADPTRLPPTALFRLARTVEPPERAEGFHALETVPFVRRTSPRELRAGTFVAAELLDTVDLRTRAEALVFAWLPSPELTERVRTLGLPFAACTHGGGPPICWCRPPLPGLVLALAHAHGVDPTRSRLVGASAAHRALAAAVGATFVTA